MRTPHLLLAVSLFSFALAARADCVKGVGAVVKKPLSVAEFHGIRLDGSMDVVITKGAERSVEVEAQANLIELMETGVHNGIWSIATSEGFSTDKAFIVHITTPEMDLVHLDGSGDIRGDGSFDTDRMELAIAGSGNISMDFNSGKTEVSIDGSGDMVLSGKTTSLSVSIAGSGDVNAKALKASDAAVEIAGSGDVSLDASQSLEASIAGSGDVNYKGSPARISRNVMGSGEVRPLGRGPR